LSFLELLDQRILAGKLTALKVKLSLIALFGGLGPGTSFGCCFALAVRFVILVIAFVGLGEALIASLYDVNQRLFSSRWLITLYFYLSALTGLYCGYTVVIVFVS